MDKNTLSAGRTCLFVRMLAPEASRCRPKETPGAQTSPCNGNTGKTHISAGRKFVFVNILARKGRPWTPILPLGGLWTPQVLVLSPKRGKIPNSGLGRSGRSLKCASSCRGLRKVLVPFPKGNGLAPHTRSEGLRLRRRARGLAPLVGVELHAGLAAGHGGRAHHHARPPLGQRRGASTIRRMDGGVARLGVIRRLRRPWRRAGRGRLGATTPCFLRRRGASSRARTCLCGS